MGDTYAEKTRNNVSLISIIILSRSLFDVKTGSILCIIYSVSAFLFVRQFI